MIPFHYHFTFPRLFLLLSSILLVSCKKFIQINPAPNLIERGAAFSNDQTALSAASSVYLQMRMTTTHLSNGGISLYTGLSADELYNTASNVTADPFYSNSLLSNNGTINSSFWSASYANLYRINAVLEGLAASTLVTDSVRQQLTGEMKVVRALYYFYLVQLFGDVPLITTTDYQVNAVMPRTSIATVYQQIRNDLKEAQALLKNNYPSPDRARPNQWTATALLARVYLFEKNWAAAEAEANKVINAGVYNLVTNLAAVFLSNSTETIWQVVSDISNTAEGSFFIPSSTTVKPSYALTPSLLNAFETGDQRLAQWTNKNTISSLVYYYPFKYKNKSSTPITEYNIVLRLAEQYLIRAEARAEQNNLTGALADLNVVRNRAGLPSLQTQAIASIRQAILKERQTELFCEWGHRWLDLKRTGTVNEVLNVVKGVNWQPTDALYPIPFAQLQINIYLQQNPGY